MLKSLVDPLPGMAPNIGGEAPELAGVGAGITGQLITMQVESGGDADAAFGVAVADWLGPGGPGSVALNLLLGGLVGADGAPRSMTGVVVGVIEAAQPLAEKVRAERADLAYALEQLDRCLSSP